MTFIYQVNDAYVISNVAWRQFRELHARAELITSFTTVQAARAWALRQPLPVQDEVTSTYTGHTPDGLRRIREAKLGEKNPNAAGLSQEHRKNIAHAMKHRRGEFHHFYNKKHRARSRLCISVTMRETWRKHPTRWAVDVHEVCHRITGELPPGWRWGRVKFR